MPEFILHISDGIILNKVAVRKAFNALHAGKYLVSIKSIKKRSLQQNAYYWGCMVPLVRDGLYNAGYDEVKTNNDAHEVIKALFLKRKIKSKINEDEIEVTGSTAKLTTVLFNEFIEDVIKWAACYLSIQIPYPNEPITMFDEPSVILASYDHETKAIVVYPENDLITTT